MGREDRALKPVVLPGLVPKALALRALPLGQLLVRLLVLVRVVPVVARPLTPDSLS